MTKTLTQFDDALLAESGPAAITFEQWLKPVGDSVFFPPTYANPSQQKGDKPVYNIDQVGDQQVCTVDSIPSQANRIEPAFARVAEGKLVPRVTVKAKQDDGEVEVDLLEAGHRAADAIVRFSPELKDEMEQAMKALKRGDAQPLAKLAPTSLVFGVWDSRGTGVKVPRLLNSIIRAYDVHEYRRSAQYFPTIDYQQAGVASEEKLKKASTAGMAEVPATFTHGGIEAKGGICRKGSLNLVSLRDINTPDAEEAVKLRRYILGLSLVALTWFDGKTLNLRQGCQLVADPDRGAYRKLVHADGTEESFELTAAQAIEYAVAAGEAFGVGDNRTNASFDPKLAKDALKAG